MSSTSSAAPARPRVQPGGGSGGISIEHYVQVIVHRKWLVLAVFVGCSIGTFLYTRTLPDIYTSETTILVDPQRVPEVYVKATVTGDVRNRLGTLSQQILSATRLQKIIDELHLYSEDKGNLAREDIILKMRNDIDVNVLNQFNSGQDVQAFRIKYSGRNPRLVAQVANELAALFMEENLKVREQQSEGTTEFLTNQLAETRKTLEAQESKLRDFRLKHIGEMPEQETADLQILGQLQSQLQLVGEALNRAESQKSTLQAMMASQSAPVVDIDSVTKYNTFEPPSARPSDNGPSPQTNATRLKALLADRLKRYGEDHPEVRRIKALLADAEAQEQHQPATVAESKPGGQPAAKPGPSKLPPINPPTFANPVLQSQLNGVEAEIARDQGERDRLSKLVKGYEQKLNAIPVNQQEVAELTRDYEISKAHYSQILNNQMNAETATQLEIRQKGEKFSVLDPAQPAGRPARPNRLLMNSGGSVVGLGLGLAIALLSEFLGMTITSSDQLASVSGYPALESIPMIMTQADRILRRRLVMLAVAGSLIFTLALGGGVLYYYRAQIF